MTNIEWKELCEWAENLKGIKVNEINIILHTWQNKIGIVVFNDGDIIDSNNNLIALKRTPQQIKSIIENLL